MKTYLAAALLGATSLLPYPPAQAQTHLATGSQTPMPAADWVD